MEVILKKRKFRISLALSTLPVGSILGLSALLLRGPLSLPTIDPQAWATSVTASIYPLATALYVIAYVLPYFGFWALYTCLSENELTERMAFYGFMGAIVGTSFALPSLGAFSYLTPSLGALYLGGETHLITVMAPLLAGLPMAINLLGGTLYLLGTVLFGISVWRSGNLPKLTGVLMALHGLFLVSGFSIYPLLLLSWVFLLISGAWLAWMLRA